MLVATIPASDIEVGGEGGRAALERLENVIGRMEATWRTASTEGELRDRPPPAVQGPAAGEGPATRHAAVKAFSEMYAGAASEFPSECKEAEYARRMRAAYPIHPGAVRPAVRRLVGARAVPAHSRCVAADGEGDPCVVDAGEDPSLMIMPGTIPIADEEVAGELTRYLDGSWTPVIETDIDGPNSLPFHLDRENTSTFGRIAAARRVARTIYFGSAPSQHAANKGLDDRHVKLGCVQPGERSPIFGDALRRLSDQAMHLYRDGVRYWYGLKATVTRLAQDRAASQRDDEVDEQIRKRLDPLKQRPGQFAAVHLRRRRRPATCPMTTPPGFGARP
ncbi:MAG: hypothetical protein M5T61_20000 [Acidimicrobiia bacterium]|nr:hypothetical protein [Acidimicrobiia bacterium]